MIIAIGSDLCNIERIQNSLSRFGEKFERRVFTAIEQAKGNSRPFTKAGTLAALALFLGYAAVPLTILLRILN